MTCSQSEINKNIVPNQPFIFSVKLPELIIAITAGIPLDPGKHQQLAVARMAITHGRRKYNHTARKKYAKNTRRQRTRNLDYFTTISTSALISLSFLFLSQIRILT